MRRPLAMIVTVALTLALSLPGGVQSAISVQRAPGFADRIAAALPKVPKVPLLPAYPAIHLETSP